MRLRIRYGLPLLVVLGIGASACSKDSTSATVSVNAVLVSPSAPSILVGDSLQLSATPIDASGNPVTGQSVTWKSSDTTVATVSVGKVRTLKVGAVSITAMAEGVAGSAAVSVTAAAGGAPSFQNVFVVGLLETDYQSVFPSNGSTPMPFLDSLAAANGKAVSYYGNTQPSIGNFFMLATGDTVTNDDNDTTTYSNDNIVRELVSAGKTWKVYAENLPYTGYLGPDNGLYVRHHNVFTLLSDVRGSAAQQANIVSLAHLQTDVAANALPNFGMIIPNRCHVSQNGCNLDTVDAFLRTTLTPLLTNAQFQQNGMLIILFDRSNTSAVNGGGRTAWVVVSSKAKAGYASTTLFQHQSTLRLVLEGLQVAGSGGSSISSKIPGLGAAAPDMMEFFNP